MAEAAPRLATYADLEAVPEHLVVEIVDGMRETHPRPRPRHSAAAMERATEPEPPSARGRGGWIFMVEPELHPVPKSWFRISRAGAGHLWLVDPDDGVLEGFALPDGRWQLPGTVQRGETGARPLFDTAPLPLDDLFPFDDPAAPAQPET